MSDVPLTLSRRCFLAGSSAATLASLAEPGLAAFSPPTPGLPGNLDTT